MSVCVISPVECSLFSSFADLINKAIPLGFDPFQARPPGAYVDPPVMAGVPVVVRRFGRLAWTGRNYHKKAAA